MLWGKSNTMPHVRARALNITTEVHQNASDNSQNRDARKTVQPPT